MRRTARFRWPLAEGGRCRTLRGCRTLQGVLAGAWRFLARIRVTGFPRVARAATERWKASFDVLPRLCRPRDRAHPLDGRLIRRRGRGRDRSEEVAPAGLRVCIQSVYGLLAARSSRRSTPA